MTSPNTAVASELTGSVPLRTNAAICKAGGGRLPRVPLESKSRYQAPIT